MITGNFLRNVLIHSERLMWNWFEKKNYKITLLKSISSLVIKAED